MGQIVSCLFGCIRGEAEKEESLSDPNLQTCPLIAPPKSVSCIGSSADGAIHQFMVHDSGNEDVEDKRQVYPPRWNYCSDLSSNEALQQDQLDCPPTTFSSFKSFTIELEVLQQDLLIPPPTVAPSIGHSRTNEALQHDPILPTPTMVPSIYSSTIDTFDHDLANAPSAVMKSCIRLM